MATTATRFDPRAFRGALGSFATGVTIITTRTPDGTPVGITANSFNSVSIDPPLVLFSLARTAMSLRAFDEADHWAVHILSAHQQSLSDRFARKGEDKFAGLATEAGIGGVPLLGNCSSRLQCRTTYKYEGGDHLIFVGEVLDFDRNELPPLVFHSGKYAVAARKTDSTAPGGEPLPERETGFGEEFLDYLLPRAHFQIYAQIREHVRKHALSDPEWFIVSSLMAANGRALAELARMYAITGTTLTVVMVERLVSMGLIGAQAGDSDQALLWLTDKGRQCAVEVLAAAKGIEADIVGRLGEIEAVALKNLLRQLIRLTDPGLPDMWGRPAATPQ